MSPEPTASPIAGVDWDDGTCIAHVSGEIVMERNEPFQDELLSLIARKPERLVVDFAAVSFIDSSGMATLVKVLARARKAGSELILRGMPERIRGVFEIARLDRIFRIEAGEGS